MTVTVTVTVTAAVTFQQATTELSERSRASNMSNMYLVGGPIPVEDSYMVDAVSEPGYFAQPSTLADQMNLVRRECEKLIAT